MGNLLLAISIIANAKGRIRPFTNPANKSNSFGFPKNTKRRVVKMIKPLIIALSF